MRIAIYTLGCKVNQYETQALEREAVARGHVLVPVSDQADAYVINTCTVTASSDQKSRYIIRRLRQAHPQSVVAVCGCYAQTDPEAVAALGVDLVAGTGERGAFLTLLEGASREREPILAVDAALSRRTFEVLPAGGMVGRTRAMLKVEDGCANFCSYCIIPYARGPVRSLPLAQAVAQAVALGAEGYQELVVTGIEISSWGTDLPGNVGLMELLEALSAAVPHLRLRLGSLEPRTITPDFCRRGVALKNLCPQFHLSLQSGCDATLLRMNRKYNTSQYRQSVALLREVFDHPAITTDLIVGFPGEGADEFEATLAFVEEMAFSALHVFPYSIRPGTPAAHMPNQVSKQEKEFRAKTATALARHMEEVYLEGLVGQTLAVLYENKQGTLWQGHAPNHATIQASGENLHNCLKNTKIIQRTATILLGEVVEA